MGGAFSDPELSKAQKAMVRMMGFNKGARQGLEVVKGEDGES